MLLVLPLREDRREDVGAEGRSASGWRGFEGWRPLKQEDRANYDWMHEMLYEVLLHSAAHAAAESEPNAVADADADASPDAQPDAEPDAGASDA